MTTRNSNKWILIVKPIFIIVHEKSKQGHVMAIFLKQLNLNVKKYSQSIN